MKDKNRSVWRRFAMALMTLVLVFGGVIATSTSAQAATGNIRPPFDIGQTWYICQGYNNPAVTHTGTSAYGLDLVGGPNCNSSAAGRNAVAPVGGTVAYYQASYGNLCINKTGGGSYTLTHINSSITSGSVSAGQIVGTVAGSGQRGNNGVAHIHFQMWASNGCYGDSGIPFDSAHGARICGAPDLTPSGPSQGNGTWSGTTISGAACGSSSGLADGTYILSSNTGTVYVMAGGSPLAVTSWSNVPGPHTIAATYTQAQIDAMPMYPVDGTAIRDQSGGIYVVAGGYPFAVTSLSHIPNTSWVNVDHWVLSNQLRSQPADGTVIRDYVSGSIYVVSGNAAMAVTSLGNIPYTVWTNIDGWAIANQLQRYPKDGSTFTDYATGTVYVAAGESALAVSSFGNIPPITSLPYVDHWVLENQLRQYPIDGTTVVDTSGTVYVIAGGAATVVKSFANIPTVTSLPNVDSWAITNQLLPYPRSGTYLKGYGSGQTFLSNGSAITPSSASALSVVVDDWAITNQLGGVE